MTAVHLPDQQAVPLQHDGALDLHRRQLCCSLDDLLFLPLQLNFKEELLTALQNKMASDRKNYTFVDMR
jgi:hypothetical protein